MSDLEETVRALAARVQVLEDEMAIYRLISTYGPGVDTGSSDVVAGLWKEDGVYDVDTPGPLNGRGAIGGMVQSDGHQSLIKNGCAHIMAMPLVRVDGDSAVATGYSRVYLRDGDGYRVWRVSANRWECERGPDGWHVTTRINRAIDGGDDARNVLKRGVSEAV